MQKDYLKMLYKFQNYVNKFIVILLIDYCIARLINRNLVF